jgi:hypothetical protein
MKHIQFPIYFTTFLLLVYTMLPFLNSSYYLIAWGFFISNFLIVWMVVRVLKDGVPSQKKFSDGYFYEDRDIGGVPYPLR